MSKGLSTNVSSVLIDEKGVFDLNSDHFIISVKLREITQILKSRTAILVLNIFGSLLMTPIGNCFKV